VNDADLTGAADDRSEPGGRRPIPNESGAVAIWACRCAGCTISRSRRFHCRHCTIRSPGRRPPSNAIPMRWPLPTGHGCCSESGDRAAAGPGCSSRTRRGRSLQTCPLQQSSPLPCLHPADGTSRGGPPAHHSPPGRRSRPLELALRRV